MTPEADPIGRCLEELAEAHLSLDRLGILRERDEQELTLSERIAVLRASAIQKPNATPTANETIPQITSKSIR